MSDPVKKTNIKKDVIYTNTAIGFEKLNEEILKTQKAELQAIFGARDSSLGSSDKKQPKHAKSFSANGN